MLNSVAPFLSSPTHRYDIKGCEVSRWVEPAPEDSPIVLVLKDLNFQGKTIDLGEPWRQSVHAIPPFRVKLEGCPWPCLCLSHLEPGF